MRWIKGFLFALWLWPAVGQAQLLEVEQVIFGMDCAPCAHAMERRLQQLEGVDSVRVSLNEGRAWLWLHPDNRLTLQMIRQAIWDAGFAAREAVVRVQGELVSSQDSWLLHLPSGQVFRLAFPEEELPQPGMVELWGMVPSGREADRLQVLRIVAQKT